MKTVDYFAFAMLSLAFMSGMTSCRDEEYIEIIAVTSCSPDLLQFVDPTVTISCTNGETQTFKLSPSDFIVSDKGGSISIDISINGVISSTSSTVTNNIAQNTKKFEAETVTGEIQVAYTQKENVAIDKDQYIFYHGIGYDIKTVNKDGISITTEGAYVKPAAYVVSDGEVVSYLENLVKDVDKTSFRASVSKSRKKQVL